MLSALEPGSRLAVAVFAMARARERGLPYYGNFADRERTLLRVPLQRFDARELERVAKPARALRSANQWRSVDGTAFRAARDYGGCSERFGGCTNVLRTGRDVEHRPDARISTADWRSKRAARRWRASSHR